MKNKKGNDFLMGLMILLLLFAVIFGGLFAKDKFFPKATAQFLDMIPSIGCPGNSTEVYILTPETFKACENEFKKDEKLSAIHSSISEHIPTILWDSYEDLDDQNVCVSSSKTPLQTKLCSQMDCLKKFAPVTDLHISNFKKYVLKTTKYPPVNQNLFDEKQDTYYETKCLKTS